MRSALRVWRAGVISTCALAALLSTILPASANETAAGYPLTIASPRGPALVTSGTVTVKVRARQGVHDLRASIDGRLVRISQHRGLYVVRFAVASLRRGENSFGVLARGAHNRRFRAHVVLVRARHHAQLGRLWTGSSLPLSATVRVARRAYLRAYLNGHAVDRLFSRLHPGSAAASLSASDGLRYGRNVLRVSEFKLDGRHWETARSFVVSRRRPLAGAGTDRTVTTGQAVHLDGRASVAPARGERLIYRWGIASKPRGSRVRLTSASTAQPVLHTDRHGVYRVRLEVIAVRRSRHRKGGGDVHDAVRHGALATDTVTVSAADGIPPLGAPITISGTQDGDTVQIGSKISIPLPASGYTVIPINRDASQGGPLAPPDVGPAIQIGNEQQLDSVLGGLPNDDLVVVVSSGGATTNSASGTELTAALADIGASPVTLAQIPGSNGQDTWVPRMAAIGIPGTPVGQAYEQFVPYDYSGTETADIAPMSGYITRDSASGNLLSTSYTFAPKQYVPYSMNAKTGQITVGCNGQTSVCQRIGSAGGQGFNVLVMNARTLSYVGNSSFGSSPSQLAELANYLALYSSNPDDLVFLLSTGGPEPNSTAWNAVAQQVALLGGDINIFDTFNGTNASSGVSDYALVGGAGLPGLAKQVAGGSDTVSLQANGVLTPSNFWRFYPMSVAPVSSFSTPLTTIAYEPSQSFPLRTGDYPNVQRYIAGLTCAEPASNPCPFPPDVRSQYWKKDISWGALSGPLDRLGYPDHVITVDGDSGKFTLTWAGKTKIASSWIKDSAVANEVQYALYTKNHFRFLTTRVYPGASTGSSHSYLVTGLPAGKLIARASSGGPSVTVTACTSGNPTCAGFTAQELAKMKTEFITTEWPDVDRVGELMDDLWSPFLSGSGTNYVDIEAISNNIYQSLSVANSNTNDKILATVQNIISIASSIAGFIAASPDHRVRSLPGQNTGAGRAAAVMGGISAVFGIASIWTDDSSGGKILQSIQTQTQNLASDAAYSVEQSQFGLERLREILVSDPNKMANAVNYANGKIPWNAVQQTSAVNDLTTATKQNAYNTLLPTAYSGGEVLCQPSQISNPGPSDFNRTIGFQGADGAVQPVVTGYSFSVPSKFSAAVFGQPTSSATDLNAGETPSTFWTQQFLPTSSCNYNDIDTLTVKVTGAGSGIVTGPTTSGADAPPGINCGVICTWPYSPGLQFVTLTATPNPGSVTNWQGPDCFGSNNTCNVPLGTFSAGGGSETVAFNPSGSSSPSRDRAKRARGRRTG